MNRRQRRADAAWDRKALDRAGAILITCQHLAMLADPTVTGATLILPDGSVTYLSATDARAMHGMGKPERQS